MSPAISSCRGDCTIIQRPALRMVPPLTGCQDRRTGNKKLARGSEDAGPKGARRLCLRRRPEPSDLQERPNLRYSNVEELLCRNLSGLRDLGGTCPTSAFHIIRFPTEIKFSAMCVEYSIYQDWLSETRPGAGAGRGKSNRRSWRKHYNRVRPHLSLDYQPPAPRIVVIPACSLVIGPILN